MNPRPQLKSFGSRRNNRGAVLLIALIVLVAMTLGGIAIMRSVDTTTLIAGNLAFKQRTLHAADAGVAQALNWLLLHKSTLHNDSTADGYYSSQTFDWTASGAWANGYGEISQDAAGNTVMYKIHRMCTLAGVTYNGSASGVPNECAFDRPPVTSVAAPLEGDSITGNVVFPPSSSLYYRITVRSIGPRNSESYTQSMVTISI